MRRFVVSGKTDFVDKLRQFLKGSVGRIFLSWRIGLRHLRWLQCARQFSRDQSLRLETPVWGTWLWEQNLFRQRTSPTTRDGFQLRQINGSASEGWSWACAYRGLIGQGIDDSDPSLSVLAKESSVMEIHRVWGTDKLMEKFLGQFTPTAIRVDLDVACSRDEVLV